MQDLVAWGVLLLLFVSGLYVTRGYSFRIKEKH